jgi:hypothetical protein
MSDKKVYYRPQNFIFYPALPQYQGLNGNHEKFNRSDSNQLLVYLKILVEIHEKKVTELLVAKKVWGEKFDNLIQSAIDGDITDRIITMVSNDHKYLSETSVDTWCNVSKHCSEIFELITKLKAKKKITTNIEPVVDCDPSKSAVEIDADFMKRVTGGDAITVRELHKEPVLVPAPAKIPCCNHGSVDWCACHCHTKKKTFSSSWSTDGKNFFCMICGKDNSCIC